MSGAAALSDIVLGAGQQSALFFLQQTAQQESVTTERLDTGRKVNSASDDPAVFFRSQGLDGRAAELLARKTGIDQGIQTVQSALDATSAVGALLQQLLGVLQAARSSSPSQRGSATRQFDSIGTQLAQLVEDARYQGVSLLAATAASAAIQFSERTAATLVIAGYDLVATAGGGRSLFTQAGAFRPDGSIVFSAVVANAGGTAQATGFSQLDLVNGTAAGGAFPPSAAAAIFAGAESRIERAIGQLSAVSQALGLNVALLQTRASFDIAEANTLETAGGALTLADLNAEAANAQALSLRQQLGTQALAGAGQGSLAILTLLR
jgi:flagellin